MRTVPAMMAGGRTTGPARPRRVLLAEDDRALLELLTDYLELQGLEVTAVESGDAALRAMEGETLPDAVILDIRMPGLSGAEVLRRMKEVPRLAHLPVAAMSGLHPRDLNLTAAPDHFLPKPFDVESFGRTLDQLWGED